MLVKNKMDRKKLRNQNAHVHHHPSHEMHLKRLNRVKGQIDGIEGMILAKRYCPEIIAQIRAASSALKAIEAEIFKTHLRGCVKSAFTSADVFDADRKIEEIMKMVF